MTGPPKPVIARVRRTARGLAPSYFALVMATGIVSVDVNAAGLPALSAALLWTSGAAYAALLGLTLWRLVAYRAEMAHDMCDPRRAFGFFTFTAGTHVLGTRLADGGHHGAAIVLLAVGTLSWIVLAYAVPWLSVLGRPGNETLRYADGSWFVLVVAGQSVAVLAATLERTATTGRSLLALLAVIAWCVSICLYVVVGMTVTLRLIRYKITPRDLTPPYWIAMGATAITTVAGSDISRMTAAPAALVAHDVALHISLIFWSFGTWLYPALVALGCWRHLVHRAPLDYGPGWWSMIFPLGMYSAASHELGSVSGIPELLTIASIQTWIAFIAWLLAFGTMLTLIARSVRRP